MERPSATAAIRSAGRNVAVPQKRPASGSLLDHAQTGGWAGKVRQQIPTSRLPTIHSVTPIFPVTLQALSDSGPLDSPFHCKLTGDSRLARTRSLQMLSTTLPV